MHISEILDNLIQNCVTLVKPNFHSTINLPVRDPFIFWDIITKNKNFVCKLFEIYLIKINFALENKTLLLSAYTCGKLVILITKNIHKISTQRERRYKIILELKKQISLLCLWINKSQKIYKLKEKEHQLKLPGSVTVLPLSNLRLQLVDCLFSIVACDSESGHECLTKIHDSTYHLLFVFAMEKCHNNIYLAKYLEFVKILFKYGTELTILNAVIKVNLMSDLARFFKEFVQIPKKPPTELFVWFFKELAVILEEACKRTDCTIFKMQMDQSLSWVYFKAMLNENILEPGSILSNPKFFKVEKRCLSLSLANTEDIFRPESPITKTQTPGTRKLVRNSSGNLSDMCAPIQPLSNTNVPPLKNYKHLLVEYSQKNRNAFNLKTTLDSSNSSRKGLNSNDDNETMIRAKK